MGNKSTLCNKQYAVNKYVGTAYDTVKKVSDNIEDVSAVADALGEEFPDGGLANIADNLDQITVVEENINDVNTVADNILEVIEVADNIDAVLDAPNQAELAYKWAQEAEDVEVLPSEYSAYHYSKKSEEQAIIATEAADSIGRYQGLWPDTGGSANKGDTYQTQVSGTPTGQYFTALQNTTVDPVGDDVNWKVAGTIGQQNLSDYTDIVYKASGGNSAVDNMITGNPTAAKVGDICSTGGSAWERISDLGSDISDFRVINYLDVVDFGAYGIGDDTSAIQKALDIADNSIIWLRPNITFNVTKLIGKSEKLVFRGGGTLNELWVTPQDYFDNFPVVMLGVDSNVEYVDIQDVNFDASGYGVAWTVDLAKGYPGNQYYPNGLWAVGTFDPFSNFNNVKRTTIKGCNFKEFYGRGIAASGVVDITGNVLVDCTGYKPIHDPGESFDADGDGIYITNTGRAGDRVYGGQVAANSIKTTVDGRAGIVFEFFAGNVSVEGNDIGTKYERGIHCETNGNAIINIAGGNRIRAQNCILVADTQVIANGNDLEVIDTGSGKIYESLAGAVTLIGGCNDSVFSENRMVGYPSFNNYQVIYGESGNQNIKITNNPFISGSIVFIGANEVDIDENTWTHPTNQTTDKTFYMGGGGTYNVRRNKMTNISSSGETSVSEVNFDDNEVDYSSGILTYAAPLTLIGTGNTLLRMTGNKLKMTNNNTSQALYWDATSSGQGGDVSGNEIITTSTTQEMVGPNPNSSHPFSVNKANVRVNPTNSERKTSRFNTFDGSGYQGRTAYGTAIPVTGTWEQNDTIINIGFSGGGSTYRWICSVGGTPGSWVPLDT